MRIPPYSKNVLHIRLVAMVLMALTVLLGVDHAAADNAHPVTKAQVQEAYGKLPLSFEANHGQTDSRVKFLSRGSGYTLFLTQSEAVLTLRQPKAEAKVENLSPVTRHLSREYEQAVLRMRLVGANPASPMSGLEELPGKVNYFVGKDPQKWRTNVPTFAKVKQPQVYPGVDLVYYGHQRQLEFDFVVAPGADPNTIRLKFEGPDRLEVDAQGDLVLRFASGDIRLPKPLVYQTANGARHAVSGRYVLTDQQQVGFEVRAYDASMPLIIDPTLFYSTYLGGSDSDEGLAIAVDAAGNAYVTGTTLSPNFPTTPGAFQTALASQRDVFVTMLNPTGSGLVYSTYLGGSLPPGNFGSVGTGIFVEATGNTYVTGYTDSTNFPTTFGAFRTGESGGGRNAFVTKLNPSGSALVYSTYLLDRPLSPTFSQAIAVDTAGNAFVTGYTYASNFPTTPGAFQTRAPGPFFCSPCPNAAFVTKVDPTGSGLVYSTYLGGSGGDMAYSIAVDTAGNAYVTGQTRSTDFPTTAGAFQTTFSGTSPAFVTKLNPTGSGLVFSTYLGSANDAAYGIVVDAVGNAYVTGQTFSTNFPTTAGAFQTANAGNSDAFVTKVNPLGTGLVYSTYLGGSDNDAAYGIAVDAVGNAYVTGQTFSTNFPTTAGAFQTALAGPDDAFVTTVNPMGAGLVYSTFLGGSGDDDGRGIAVDSLPSPNAYVTGVTGSINFPTTTGAFQTTYGGFGDAFVAKIINIILPPPPTVGKVTGGGTINVTGGIGNFGFIVQRQAVDGSIQGDLQYINHESGAKVHSVGFTSFAIVGTMATFGGTCRNNGKPCTFTVDVIDNGEPGFTDTFTISVSGGPTEGGTLRSGNILIHQ